MAGIKWKKKDEMQNNVKKGTEDLVIYWEA